MAAAGKASKVAARYARAIFDFAGRDKEKLDALSGDLTRFQRFIQENEKAFSAVTKPAFPVTKRALLVEDFANRLGLGAETKKVLSILAKADRISALGEIIDRLAKLRLQDSDLISLVVESASELSAEQQKRVISRFGVLLGKPIEPTFTINPALIGGFRATANGKSYDGSVSSWLNYFQERNAGGL